MSYVMALGRQKLNSNHQANHDGSCKGEQTAVDSDIPLSVPN